VGVVYYGTYTREGVSERIKERPKGAKWEKKQKREKKSRIVVARAYFEILDPLTALFVPLLRVFSQRTRIPVRMTGGRVLFSRLSATGDRKKIRVRVAPCVCVW